MQFKFALGLLVLSLEALANSSKFTLETLVSGSPIIWKHHSLEYTKIFEDGPQLYVSKNETAIPAEIDDEGYLKLENGNYVQIKKWDYLFVGPRERASKGFSIKDGYLYFNHNEGFVVIPDSFRYIISTKQHDDHEVGVVIKVNPIHRGHIKDYH